MRTMRKVKKGQIYMECGKDGRPEFMIEHIRHSHGDAETSQGTFIQLSRLASTKWYKLIG